MWNKTFLIPDATAYVDNPMSYVSLPTLPPETKDIIHPCTYFYFE